MSENHQLEEERRRREEKDTQRREEDITERERKVSHQKEAEARGAGGEAADKAEWERQQVEDRMDEEQR